MFCGLDLLLMAVGIWLMTVKTLSFGRMEVPSPRPLFMGIILLLQAPVGFASLFALGAAEGIVAARDGSTPDSRKLEKKYGWLSWGIPLIAVATVGGVGVLSLRAKEYAMANDDCDDVVGIRNLIRERNMREHDEEDEPPDPVRHRFQPQFPVTRH